MELARRGCNVALVARNQSKMRDIASEIGKLRSKSKITRVTRD
jgi:short-subunit dehydrogenase